jgi:polysaccharide biosynthesis protein PslG
MGNLMRLGLLFLLIVVSLGGASPPESPFLVGVCTHFGQNKGNVQANLNLIHQAGANSIRDEVFWQGVEPQPGRYAIPKNSEYYVTQAVALGLKPLLSLDYGNRFYDQGDKPTSDEAIEGYARYAEFVVRHFKNRVFTYEIWNEWNGGVGKTTPGTAETYVRLLKVVYPRLKSIDPNLTIIAGAVSGGGVRGPWLRQMLDAGALKSADALSFHQYIFSSTGRGRTPEALIDNINRVEDIVRGYNDGHDFPLYLTETGWPTLTGPSGTSLNESGNFLAQTILLSRTLPFLRGVWWYDFQDDGPIAERSEDNFGIVRTDLTPKPAYVALSAVTRWINGAEFLSRIKTSDPFVDGVRFRTQDGQQAMAIWRQVPGADRMKISGATMTRTLQSAASSTNSAKTSALSDIELTQAPTWVTGNNLELR